MSNKPIAAVAVGDAPVKKTKKVEVVPGEAQEKTPKSILKKNKPAASKGTEDDGSSLKLNGERARPVKPRKRAADFLSDEEDSDGSEAHPDTTKKASKASPGSKKAKKTEIASSAIVDEQAPEAERTKSAKTSGKEEKKRKTDDAVEEEDGVSSVSDSDDDGIENDQAVAFLKGFESSGDEDDGEGEEYDPNQPVPNIPDSKKVKRKLLKKQKKLTDTVEQPGTVYVG